MHFDSKLSGVLISDSKNLSDRLNQTVLTLKGAEKPSTLKPYALKKVWQLRPCLPDGSMVIANLRIL